MASKQMRASRVEAPTSSLRSPTRRRAMPRWSGAAFRSPRCRVGREGAERSARASFDELADGSLQPGQAAKTISSKQSREPVPATLGETRARRRRRVRVTGRGSSVVVFGLEPRGSAPASKRRSYAFSPGGGRTLRADHSLFVRTPASSGARGTYSRIVSSMRNRSSPITASARLRSTSAASVEVDVAHLLANAAAGSRAGTRLTSALRRALGRVGSRGRGSTRSSPAAL